MRSSKTGARAAASPAPQAGDRLWSATDTAAYLGVPIGTLY
jgi:hypothetical protein